MNPDLKGKAAVVTGGGSGIGKAIAEALATHGANVLICGRTLGTLKDATAELSPALEQLEGAGQVLPYQTDVSRADEVEAMIAAAVKQFGRIDVLVNNAGILTRGRIVELTEQEFDRCLAINLKGAFLCARSAWEHLAASGQGYIFNIASFAATKGMAGVGAYCASKFALRGLSQSMSEEGKACGIRACAICPGYVETPMVAGADVPGADMIRPGDIAELVLSQLRVSPVAVVQEIVVHRTTG